MAERRAVFKIEFPDMRIFPMSGRRDSLSSLDYAEALKYNRPFVRCQEMSIHWSWRLWAHEGFNESIHPFREMKQLTYSQDVGSNYILIQHGYLPISVP